VARITNVQADRFTVYIDEPPNRNGVHAAETVSYLVLEAGQWQLPGGGRLEVGLVETSAAVGRLIPNAWERVTFGGVFGATPVVLTQVQTNNDASWVGTREWNVSVSGFSLAMEEEEASTAGHGMETVGWLAMTPGKGDWSGHLYEAANTGRSVNDTWRAFSFGQHFGAAPRFIGWVASYNGSDSVVLRYRGLTAAMVELLAQEDTTRDSEVVHAVEVVSYIAVQGDGLLMAEEE
jgi:hypothetical protein